MSVYEESEGVTRLGWDMWKRFLIGAVLVILLSATAVASGVLLQVHDTIAVFQNESTPIPGIKNELDKVDPGGPQTILVLGSDGRYGEKGIPVRSDTMIVVRLDPDKNATAVMSIPRDLKVEIPGHGSGKINTAFALGGPRLSVRTVKALLSIPISHVVNVNFNGFQRAVNRLGCVFVDIDRRYFNDRGGPGGYATIDIKPGYQKLCGSDSLDYVRYRHLDDDFVRAARQQDFLRQAKGQIGLGKVFGDRKELLRIFGRYTDTDIARDNDAAILRLIKLAYDSTKQPDPRGALPRRPGRRPRVRRDHRPRTSTGPSTSSSTSGSARPPRRPPTRRPSARSPSASGTPAGSRPASSSARSPARTTS